MTTLTFKVEDEEAEDLRAAARRAGLSLSEYLRRQLRGGVHNPDPVRVVRCPDTGALMIAGTPPDGPINSDEVRRIMADFP